MSHEVVTMLEDESRSEWRSKDLSLHLRGWGTKRTDLQGEANIRELISRREPLPNILNRLCTAIDLQIGNIVSVILPSEDHEHDLRRITYLALQFGLHDFWSARISLIDDMSFGFFGIYCCVSRTPTVLELRVIQRATHLAVFAIRHQNGKDEYERSISSATTSAI
jgi:hypothetical protein